jgi:hypothetical protein
MARGRLLAWSLVLLAACGGNDEQLPSSIDASAGAIDARPIDAREVDAGVPLDAAEVGVRCGPEEDLCVPGTSQGCCEHPDGGVGCEPSAGLCLGRLTSCDGPEDCDNPGLRCCELGFGPSCTEPSNCTSETGGTVVCHGDGDCPAGSPACCDGLCAAACE